MWGLEKMRLQYRIWLYIVLILFFFFRMFYYPKFTPAAHSFAALFNGFLFVAVSIANYLEVCPICGLQVWKRHPERFFEFSLGPFWIPRTCAKCGHKHK
jgi:hypothetical protein